jgi:pimeloyl-ACP methyl ester carboxylesterase
MQSQSLYRSPSGEREVMAIYDRVLAHWPVPYETITVSTRCGNTFMIASGEKSSPPLMLLHGSCSNALSWIGEVTEYSRYFRVYSIDIPGEPGKSTSNRPSWNSPAYADWMEDVLNNLNFSRVCLLGLSQGGWTALKFATYHPERVEKLVLLTPAGIIRDKTSFLLRAILFSSMGFRGAEALTRFTFGDERIDPEALIFMNAIMTHFKPRIGSLAMYTDEELKRLMMPLLLLGGAKDRIRNVEKIAARLKDLLPHTISRIYPERGHVLVNVTDQVIPFLLSTPKVELQ